MNETPGFFYSGELRLFRDGFPYSVTTHYLDGVRYLRTVCERSVTWERCPGPLTPALTLGHVRLNIKSARLWR